MKVLKYSDWEITKLYGDQRQETDWLQFEQLDGYLIVAKPAPLLLALHQTTCIFVALLGKLP